MKQIAFYISNHGFGHIARNIPIIKSLIQNHDVYIHLKCGNKHIEFARSNLMGLEDKITYYTENTDIGLVLKQGTMDIDRFALEKGVTEYINGWDARVTKEIAFLKDNDIECIVSDIVPWILRASKQLSLPSILVSNFTWVEIYEEYLCLSLYTAYLNCYKLADKVILYDLYNQKLEKYLDNFTKVSLISRKFNTQKVQLIRSKHKRPIVYISVGRSVDLDGVIDVNKLAYDFFVTEGILLTGRNVTSLPSDIKNTQDYILASDYIISKAGWSSVSEALLAGKKLALLSRNNVAEDRNTIKILKKRNHCIEIKMKELSDISSVIAKLDEFQFSSLSIYRDSCEEICTEIMSLC